MFLKLSCLSDSARSVKSFESVCSIVRWRVFITLCRGILWNQHFFQYSFMAPTIVHEVAFNDLRWWLSKRILLIHGLEIKLLNQKKEEKIVHCNSRLIKIWLVSLKKKSDEEERNVVHEGLWQTRIGLTVMISVYNHHMLAYVWFITNLDKCWRRKVIEV